MQKAYDIGPILNPSRIIAEQKMRIAQLEAELARLKSPPGYLYKKSIINYIVSNNPSLAIKLCHFAKNADPTIFESMDSVMIKNVDVRILFTPKDGNFQFYVKPDSPPSDNEKKSWAQFYKTLALEYFKMKKILCAFRLIEEALTYDDTVMTDMDYLDHFIAESRIALIKIVKDDIDARAGNLLQADVEDSNSIANFASLTPTEFRELLAEEEITDYASLPTFETPWAIITAKSDPDDLYRTRKISLYLILTALGYQKTFQWLMASEKDKDIFNALHAKWLVNYASRFNQFEMCEFLVKNLKLPVNYPINQDDADQMRTGLFSYGCPFSPTIMDLYCSLNGPALMNAIRNNNTDLINFLLANGAMIDEGDPLGRTPLIVASQSKALTSVACLLKYKPDLNKLDNDGMPALQYACMNGNVEIAIELHAQGARMHPALYREENMPSPILIAALSSRSVDKLKMVLNLGIEFPEDNMGTMFAIDDENLDLLKYMLLDFQSPLSKDGTELIFACRKGNLPIVQFLIENGATIDDKGFETLINQGPMINAEILDYLKHVREPLRFEH